MIYSLEISLWQKCGGSITVGWDWGYVFNIILCDALRFFKDTLGAATWLFKTVWSVFSLWPLVQSKQFCFQLCKTLGFKLYLIKKRLWANLVNGVVLILLNTLSVPHDLAMSLLIKNWQGNWILPRKLLNSLPIVSAALCSSITWLQSPITMFISSTSDRSSF